MRYRVTIFLALTLALSFWNLARANQLVVGNEGALAIEVGPSDASDPQKSAVYRLVAIVDGEVVGSRRVKVGEDTFRTPQRLPIASAQDLLTWKGAADALELQLFKDDSLVDVSEVARGNREAHVTKVSPALVLGPHNRRDPISGSAKSSPACDECYASDFVCRDSCEQQFCEFGNCREPQFSQCVAVCQPVFEACYTNNDCDADGIGAGDNCGLNPNPDQADCDSDGAGNVCDSLNGTYMQSGESRICHVDEDGLAPIYYRLELYRERRLIDTSACGAPDRWQRFLADEGSYFNVPTFTACAEITEGQVVPWCTFGYNQNFCLNQ
jgi:hypothetical protein